MDLSMRLAKTLVPTFPHQQAVADHHSSDQWVRLNIATPSLRQFQGMLHPPMIVICHATPP
jgi:hypothetical protein